MADRPPLGDGELVSSLHRFLKPLPLVAVLRGITPAEVDAVGAALVDNGSTRGAAQFARPFESIASGPRIRRALPHRCGNGARSRRRVADAGGGSSSCRTATSRSCARPPRARVPAGRGGTEAFAALDAGADGLKMFPRSAFAGGAEGLARRAAEGTSCFRSEASVPKHGAVLGGRRERFGKARIPARRGPRCCARGRAQYAAGFAALRQRMSGERFDLVGWANR